MIDCTYCFPFVQEVHEDPGQAPLSTSHPEGPVPAPAAPEPAPAAGSQAEKAIPSKSLLDWLRQQADDYSLDVPGFGAVSVCWCHLTLLSASANLVPFLKWSMLRETRKTRESGRDLCQLRTSFES